METIMKLFIDTANLDHIREINSWGVVDGVTTNPSLAAREGRDFAELIAEICDVVDGPISAEVVAPDAEGMLREARLLAKIHDNVVIKVPICSEGIKAVNALTKDGIRTNVTLIFNATQALLAAKVGATFVSPFVGRIDDIGFSGMELIEDLVTIFDTYALDTQVLSASIRTTQHVLDSARAGSHASTIPYGVFKKLLKHPQTDLGVASFMADWAKVPGGGDVEAVVSRFLERR